MAEFPFRDALNAFDGSIRGSLVEVDEAELETFVELFAGDFAAMLSVSNGDAIWRRDRARILELGAFLGTFARFFATAEGGRHATVRDRHLREALGVIKPRCKVGEEDDDDRKEYCKSIKL